MTKTKRSTGKSAPGRRRAAKLTRRSAGSRPVTGRTARSKPGRDVIRRKWKSDPERLIRTLKAVSASNQAMMRAQDEAGFMKAVCRIIVECCGRTMVWIGIAENDPAKTVRPVGYSGFEAGYLDTLHITWADNERGRGPTGTAIRTGRPCVCRDMQTDPRFRPWREEAEKRGYSSSIALPFSAGGEVNGAIMIYSRKADDFPEEEVALLSELASDLGYGLHALRLRVARDRLLAEGEEHRRLAQQFADEMSAVFGSMSEAVLVYDSAGRILRANAAAVRLIGFDPANLSATEIAAQLSTRHFDGRRLDPSDLPTVMASAAPLLRGNRSAGAVTVMHDISEQTKLEERLLRSRDELESQVRQRTGELELANAYNRSLFEAGIDPLVTITPDGKIGDANRATELVTGFSREELLGRDFSSLFTDEEKARTGYRRAFDEGKVRDYELEIRHRDGRLTPVLYNASVFTDERRKVKGVIAAARDITRRRQAEAQARRNLRRVEVTAEISHLLVEAGPDYRPALPRIAEAVADILGEECRIHLPTEDGRLPPAAVHRTAADDAGRSKEGSAGLADVLIQQVFQTRQPLILPARPPEGAPGDGIRGHAAFHDKPFPSSLLAVPLLLQDTALGVLTAARYTSETPYAPADLTLLQTVADRLTLAIANANLFADLKNALAEEQKTRVQLIRTEKLAAMGRVLGSVAHELNNPLQTIKNCLYLLKQETPAGGIVREYIDMASSETNRLVHLVAQLRELYRPHSEKNMQRHDLGVILRDVHSLLIPQLQSGKVEWKEADGPRGCAVRCDKERIQQVFINLAVNAIEAMQPDGGALTVGLTLSEDSFRVGAVFKDTGPGVNPDLIHNLFDPFITTKPSGLGLGLSICYEIAQKHGGSIAVENPPGGGAVFTLWLPLEADA
jgi:PAS domain S-box-containing protein